MSGKQKEAKKFVEVSHWKYGVGDVIGDRNGRKWTVRKQALVGQEVPIYWCDGDDWSSCWITEHGIEKEFRVCTAP